jgi:hypothetical protein
MPSLACLNLCATAVTDKGVAELLASRTLVDLGLAQTAISDGALPALKQFAKLRSINLKDTKITRAGVEESVT